MDAPPPQPINQRALRTILSRVSSHPRRRHALPVQHQHVRLLLAVRTASAPQAPLPRHQRPDQAPNPRLGTAPRLRVVARKALAGRRDRRAASARPLELADARAGRLERALG